MENIQMINGDCIDEMKKLSKGSVDFLFCDLPYMGIDNKTSEVACEWNTPINLIDLWKEINRITKPTTPCFFTCSTKFGVALINSNPKNFRYDIVWIKSSPCGHLNARKMPMKKHEMIYVFYRKLPYYDLSSHKFKYKDENCVLEKTKEGVYGKEKAKYRYYNDDGTSASGIRYDPPLPNSILQIKSEKGAHNTQKPIELITWLLKYYSKEGDLVLDPTAGSFSTAIACLDMKRNFIGYERDVKIYNKALIRVAKHLNKTI
jgi:DNA modification methylase